MRGAYYSAPRLVAETLDVFLPAKRQSVAEHAAEKRMLANEGGGYVGRWRHEKTPYLMAPMEALTDPAYTTVALVGPGQCGKTEVAHNWLLHSVDVDPADFLWYMQTDLGLAAHVKNRIDPLIGQHDWMRRKLGLRPVDNSLHYKRFLGMAAEFLSATHSNLINKRAPRIVGDEYDDYAPALGNVQTLLDVRRQTYGDASMVLLISHPDRARGLNPAADWTDGIMAVYADSTRAVAYWQCPQCGGWSSPNPLGARVMALDYPSKGSLDEVESAVHLVCPIGGCMLDERARLGMIPSLTWVGMGQAIAEDGRISGELLRRRTAGFWIVGLMSPFLLGGMPGLVRNLVKAERDAEKSGDATTVRQVVVKQFGLPYAPRGAVGSVSAQTLMERLERLERGQVPAGVRFLTAAVDVQIAHFEVLVRGWGSGGESWIIDKWREPGDTATRPEPWDALLKTLREARYALGDGSNRVMAIRSVGYDSGGAPGTTQQAYDAWHRGRRDKHVKLYGQVSGRDLWSVVPMKGEAPARPGRKLQLVYPDMARKDRKVVRSSPTPLAIFNANLFKDDIAGELMVAQPGPWYAHLPQWLKSRDADGVETPPHVNLEQLVAESRDAQGRWTKPHAAVRNEMLDLMVMTRALAHLHGVTRIDWGKPPAWAAEWDRNSMIAAGIAAGTANPPPSGGAAARSPAAASAPTAAAPAAAATPPRRPRSIDDLVGNW